MRGVIRVGCGELLKDGGGLVRVAEEVDGHGLHLEDGVRNTTLVTICKSNSTVGVHNSIVGALLLESEQGQLVKRIEVGRVDDEAGLKGSAVAFGVRLLQVVTVNTEEVGGFRVALVVEEF